jgi:UDP-N-acetyl-2-amino-2-deoxyglucuronate dehydrogenase
MGKLKFAIIGCGRITPKHVKALVENEKDCVLAATCDVLIEKAIEKKDLYLSLTSDAGAVGVYEDYKEMVKSEKLDVVAIATESGYHEQIAIYCMEKGIHVLVEKPMAMSVAGAQRMVDTAKKSGVKLGVCYQNRFNPPIQALKKAIDQGRFGRIFAGNARTLWNRNKDYYTQAPWRGTKELDGGCLMNQCIHVIDLLQWMLGGKSVSINAMLDNYNHPYIEMEDYGSLQIRFENGAIGNVEGTTTIYPHNLEETLTIIGEKGLVKIGGLAVNNLEHWRFKDASSDEEEKMRLKLNGEVDCVYGSGHTPLFADFIDAIKQNRRPYIDGEDGIESIKIILTGYENNN